MHFWHHQNYQINAGYNLQDLLFLSSIYMYCSKLSPKGIFSRDASKSNPIFIKISHLQFAYCRQVMSDNEYKES